MYIYTVMYIDIGMIYVSVTMDECIWRCGFLHPFWPRSSGEEATELRIEFSNQMLVVKRC